jgi:uncharacterized protein (TIGR02646 family)
MRPVERGTTSQVFSEYQQARGLLIKRMGEYCSYCEMRLGASLAVEHVQPKDLNPALALVWENFLLGCTNCNSTKGSKKIALADYFWADQDNTARAFEYALGGFVRVSPKLSATEQAKAERTMQLVGLEKRPPINAEAADRRWSNRREAWDVAERSYKRLKAFNAPAMREEIIENAVGRGFWSVWMTVFADDPDMLERLIQAFPGTAACFDSTTFLPIARVGGAL